MKLRSSTSIGRCMRTVPWLTWIALALILMSGPRVFADPVLWYDSPARTWNKVLPVGNGHLGAMAFGNTTAERIQLNEDTIWWDAAKPDVTGVSQHLPEIRRLLFAGEYERAEQVLQQNYFIEPGVNHGTYQTLGDLWITMSSSESRQDYRRELDLETGIARREWADGGIRFSREVFASAPHDVLVVRRRPANQRRSAR